MDTPNPTSQLNVSSVFETTAERTNRSRSLSRSSLSRSMSKGALSDETERNVDIVLGNKTLAGGMSSRNLSASASIILDDDETRKGVEKLSERTDEEVDVEADDIVGPELIGDDVKVATDGLQTLPGKDLILVSSTVFVGCSSLIKCIQAAVDGDYILFILSSMLTLIASGVSADLMMRIRDGVTTL